MAQDSDTYANIENINVLTRVFFVCLLISLPFQIFTKLDMAVLQIDIRFLISALHSTLLIFLRSCFAGFLFVLFGSCR